MSRYCAAIACLAASAVSQPAAPTPALGTVKPHSHAASRVSVPATTFVAGCDRAPALLDRFRQRRGATFPEARGYTDHPHARIVVDGVESGVKGIFCEKPSATTLAELIRPAADGAMAVSRLSAPPTTWCDSDAAIRELIGLVERGGAPSSTGEDGRRTLAILLGILQSSPAGGARVDCPIEDR